MIAYSLVSLALLELAAAGPLAPRAAPVDELVGFGAGTTGGGDSGNGTTVSSCADLESALESGGVISVDGMLEGCGTLDVLGDTTVIGVGAESGIFQVFHKNFIIDIPNILMVLTRILWLWPPHQASQQCHYPELAF